MTYYSFAHLFLANRYLLEAIKAEYGQDCYTDDDEVVDPNLPMVDGTVAYLDFTEDVLTVTPVNELAHKRLNININQGE